MSRVRALAAVIAVACLVASCGASPAPSPSGPTVSVASTPSAGIAAVIAKYQARIPQLMAEQDIPGLSLAVVDGDKVLWEQAFGYTDRSGSRPVTLNTIFSVQSMSKFFTATAVMRAVQDGKVDLDVPITRYLPDFTVHSAFEEHPEQLITMRMLLSHTAGFAHEAPVGNNDELDPGTFDEHVASISDTWLRFPVGTGYAYSNLGIDLALYILEKVYGKSFDRVMDDLLLAPLGMNHSTFNREKIRATQDRATGYVEWGIPAPAVDVAMSGAGGLYSSAGDLARFLSFQVGNGTIEGKTILDPKLIEDQRGVPPPNLGALSGYALGVARTRWRAENYQDLFTHNGGGYGFLSDLWFVPSLGIGIAILTNSIMHDLQGDLALSIMRDLVDATDGVYAQRLAAAPLQDDVIDLNTSYLPPVGFEDQVASLALPTSAEQSARWAGFAGTYQIRTMGAISPNADVYRFQVDGGVPLFDAPEPNGGVIRHQLTEFQPGLFLAENGDTLDFRDVSHPTWRNLDLIPATGGPAPWQWGLMLVAGLAAVAWFAGGAWRAVRRRASGAEGADGAAGRLSRRWSWAIRLFASLTALFALASIAFVAIMPGIVDSGFLGGYQFPLPLRLLLHVPFALAVSAGCVVALIAVGVARRRLDPRAELRVGVLVVGAALLVAQLAAWHLIGWGLA